MKRFGKLLAVLMVFAMMLGTITVTAVADPQTATSVARVGDDYYDTLADAVAAADDSNPVKLLCDVSITQSLSIKKTVTIENDNAEDIIIDVSGVTSDYAFNCYPDSVTDNLVTFRGNSGRIIIDGGNASRSKSMVYIRNCNAAFSNVVLRNTKSTGRGPALDDVNGQVTLNNCIIENNDTSTSSGGGAIYITYAGTQPGAVILNNCIVRNNRNTSGPGGAVQGAQGSSGKYLSSFTANNTVFTGNSASGNGAVIRSNGNFAFNDCLFFNNSSSDADISEGNTYTSTRTIDGCTFDKAESSSHTGSKAVLGGTSANSFSVSVSFAPSAKAGAATEKDFDGNVVVLSDFIDGFDADKMDAAITCAGEPAAEIRAAGAYTVTVTAKTGGILINDEYATVSNAVFGYIVNAVQIVENVARVNGTEYGTLGEAIIAAGSGGTVELLKDLDSATIDANVVLTGNKTITNATITSAALPLDLTAVAFTNTTFSGVDANTSAFTGTFAGKYGTLTNAGMVIDVNGSFTISNYEALVGANAASATDRYATFAEAVAAATAGQTVVLCSDTTIDSQLIISKGITVTTDGVADRTITFDQSFASGWAIDIRTSYSEFKGTGNASRLVLDGRDNARDRGLLYVHTGNGALVEYVTVKNTNSTTTGNNGAAAIYVSTGNENTETLLDHIIVQDCNTAGRGAIALASLNLKIQNSEFYRNHAQQDGGVINNSSSNAAHNKSVVNCVFSGNSSDGNGQDVNSVADNLTITGCTFDHTEAEAVNGSYTDGGGNTFAIELSAPVAKAVTYTGLDLTIGMLVTGYDADKMTYVSSPATVREVGTYTLTFTAKEGYVFPGSSATAQVTVTVAAPAPEASGDTELSMLAEVGDTITAVFFADVDSAVAAQYESIVLKAQLGSATPVELTGTPDANGIIKFSFENIFMQCMTKKIKGTVVGRNTGSADVVLASITEGISIAEYCDQVAAAYPERAALLNFMANMLNLGAEAQKYIGETTGLANVGHDWAASLYGSAAPVSPVIPSELNVFANGWNKEDGKIKSASLHIDNKIAIRFTMELPDATGAVLTVSAAGMTAQVFELANYASDSRITKDGNLYRVYLDKINPDQYDTVYTAVLSIGGNNAQTVKYSVNTYCARKAEDAGVGDFAVAAYNFGVAAKAYNGQ